MILRKWPKEEMNLRKWPDDFHKVLLKLAKAQTEKGEETSESWNHNWNKLMEFKRKNIPKTLLRFRPIQDDDDLKLRKSEIDGVLYFCDVRKQNDPFDTSLLSMESDNSDDLERVKRIITDARNSGFIACFNACQVESYHTLPMWAHYAKDHKGCCMRYDNVHSWPIEWQDALFPVNYRDNFQDFLNDFKVWESDKKVEWQYEDNALYKYVMTNKLDQWSYENEWRIILDKNLLKRFSKKDDMNIRIYPEKNEQGIAIFKDNNDETEIVERFENNLKDDKKNLDINLTSENNEPLIKGISMCCLKPSEIIFGKNINNNYRNSLIEHGNVVGIPLNNSQIPTVVSRKPAHLAPLGERLINQRFLGYNKIKFYDMSIDETLSISLQEVNIKEKYDLIIKLVSLRVSNNTLQEVAEKLGIDQNELNRIKRKRIKRKRIKRI